MRNLANAASSVQTFGEAGHAAARHPGGPRAANFRPAARLTCAALIALATAACSQETQRFDYRDETRTTQRHSEQDQYMEDKLASWRRSERGDLTDRRTALRHGPVTSSLADDAPKHVPLQAGNEGDEDRSRLAPLQDTRRRPPRREAHTVRSGDTLYSIAQQYDVGVDALARLNGVDDPGRIRVGDELYIPEPGHDRRRYARGEDSWRDDGRAAQRGRRQAEEPRRSRDRRHAGADEPRYSDDQLYVDPLLGDRERREPRRRYETRRRTAERPSDDRREDAERRRTADRRETERQPRRRVSSAQPQRHAPTTPPPMPDQRPEAVKPVRTASTQSREEPRPEHSEQIPATQVARAEPAPEAKKKSADCRDLMKNPPARSGANFRRPVNGRVVARFGRDGEGQRNDGINISVPRGTPVKAAENGVVVYAGNELMGLGNLVLVRHADGWVSAYAHNDELLVGRCDTVERGQEIARAGVSGSVSKPQLHFELRKNARPVDPEQHFAGTS
ncbi:MAG: peptidoglycan DD-metalloendopeptidase family protein [Dichotomicrobium sp.]